MERILQVKRREVYGRPLFYLIGPEKEHVKALTGRETVTDSDIKALKALGYSFEIAREDLSI